MGPGASGAMALAMMGGGMGDGDPGNGNIDPRTQMMRAMVLQNMQGQSDSQGDHGPDGESGGEVGTRHIDQNTTPPHIGSSDQSTMDEIGKTVPGFDSSSGLPTEFPATDRKNAAASLLQKDQSNPALKPWSLKKRIGMGLASLIPIAGPAIIGGEHSNRRQAMENVNLDREEYNAEAGLEQGQRDQALREKVAMANIETTRAMKTLMANMTHERNQNTRVIGDTRNEINAAGKGYDVTPGVGGQAGPLTPKPPMDMSEMARRGMDLQHAKTDLADAQRKAIPEMITIKKKALDLANNRFEEYLQNTEFNQDMKREGQDFREGGPTTQMRDRSQQAHVVDQTGQGLIKDIKDGASHIGPIMGRYGSLTDFIGNPPPEYAGLASELTTYIALQPAAHGFRGMRAVQEFEKSIGTPIRTPEALIAAIQGNVKGLTPMEGAGAFTPLHRATPQSQLQRKPGAGQGQGGAGGGNSPSSHRQVVRDAKGNLSFAP